MKNIKRILEALIGFNLLGLMILFLFNFIAKQGLTEYSFSVLDWNNVCALVIILLSIIISYILIVFVEMNLNQKDSISKSLEALKCSIELMTSSQDKIITCVCKSSDQKPTNDDEK